MAGAQRKPGGGSTMTKCNKLKAKAPPSFTVQGDSSVGLLLLNEHIIKKKTEKTKETGKHGTSKWPLLVSCFYVVGHRSLVSVKPRQISNYPRTV